MARVASGQHIFEANVNRFVLFLQVHGAKPRDDFPSSRRFDRNQPVVLTQ
jgi:hypothetical protein